MLKKYFLLLPIIAGCSQGGDSRLQEKADIESKTAAKNQTDAELEMQNVRANEMEQDLARRHRFFQATKGKYEGSFNTSLGEFQIRILLVPSLSPIKTERERLPEEIAYDLNNLHFNAQIQQWSAANPASAVGCRVENIKPNLDLGMINIMSSNCPNVYFLALSEQTTKQDVSAEEYYKNVLDSGASAQRSQQVLDATIDLIDEFAGFIQLTNISTSYYFRAKRVAQ